MPPDLHTGFSRGRSYYQSGKAKKLTEEYDGYSMTVRGSRNYRVHIGTDSIGDITSLSCTCPYADGGDYCKHMAAALYYLENYYGEPFYLSDDYDQPSPSANLCGRTESDTTEAT